MAQSVSYGSLESGDAGSNLAQYCVTVSISYSQVGSQEPLIIIDYIKMKLLTIINILFLLSDVRLVF